MRRRTWPRKSSSISTVSTRRRRNTRRHGCIGPPPMPPSTACEGPDAGRSARRRRRWRKATTRSTPTLLAVPDARVDVGRAFEHVMSERKSQPALGFRLPMLGPTNRPLKLAFVAAVAAAALVVVAFAASGLFFQPTTVKTVPVTVADMQALSQLADYGTL